MKSRTGRESRSSKDGQEGIALTIVLLVLVALTFAGMGIMGAARSSIQSLGNDLTTSQCLFVADSGDRDARLSILPQLNAFFQSSQLYPTTPTGVVTSTVTVGGNDTSYTATAVGEAGAPSIFDQAITIESACAGATDARMRIATRGKPTSGSFFMAGACGCQSLTLQGNVQTDSYASALGLYAGQAHGSNGNVGSDGSVSLGGSVSVGGNVASHDDTTIGGSTTVAGGVYHGGSYAGDPAIPSTFLVIPPSPCRCDEVQSDLTRPSLTGSGVDPEVTGLASLVAGAAAYNDNASIAAQIAAAGCQPASSFAGNDLQIQGTNCHVDLRPDLHSYTDPLSGETMQFSVFYLTGLDIQSGDIRIDTTGLTFSSLDREHGRYKVLIYMEGGGLWDIGGNGIVNQSDLSWILEAWHYMDPPGPATVKFHGGTAYAGTLFSSTALIDNQGTPHIYGAVTGKQFPSNGSFRFHYDETLGTARRDYVAAFEPEMWRVVRD